MSRQRQDMTFVLTDIQGSTALIAAHPDLYPAMLARHNQLVLEALAQHDGVVITFTGDGYSAGFGSSADALTFTAELQRALHAEVWPQEQTMLVRIGVHAGPVEITDEGEYVSLAIHQAARILNSAHGGQIMVSPVVAAAGGAPPGCSLEQRGEFLVRDFPDVVVLTELVVDDLPRQLLPPRASSVPRGGAHRRTSFIGRVAEQRLIAEALRHHPTVCVVGAGGVGKTRLVTEVASRTDEEYGAPQFVPLAAIGKGDDVPGAVGRAIGLGEPKDGDWVAALVAELGATASLLVVDNCEHVIGAAAELIDAITSACPKVRVLATSREPLRIDGERVITLAPLRIPPETGQPATLLSHDSVRLLIDRAVAAGGPATVGAQELVDAADIARQLDGLPLALELAAARVPTYGYAGVRAGLAERFDLLTLGRRTADSRQRTLRALVEWSYNLLDVDEQDAFRALSITSGAFTAEVLAALRSETPPAQDLQRSTELLDRLIAASLVEVAVEGGDTRFLMLETLRQFGRLLLLQSGEKPIMIDRLQRWYLNQLDVPAALRGAVLIDFTDTTAAVEAVRLGIGSQPDVLARLTVQVAGLLERAKRSRDSAVLVRQVLTVLGPVAVVGTDSVATLHAALAGALAVINDPDARTQAHRAVAACEDIADARDRSHALSVCAVAMLHLDENESAEALFRAAHELNSTLGDHLSTPPLGVGLIAGMRGDWVSARDWLTVGVDAARLTGDLDNASIGLGNLYEVAQRSGDSEGSRHALQERVELVRARGARATDLALLRSVTGHLITDGRPYDAVVVQACHAALTAGLDVQGPGDTATRSAEDAAQLRDALPATVHEQAVAYGSSLSFSQVLDHIVTVLAEPRPDVASG